MIQTWLPLPSYKDSIECLSREHLILQRLNILEIMEEFHAIPEEDSALPGDYDSHDLDGHPVLDMWKGHEVQLVELGLQTCEHYVKLTGKEDPLYQRLANHQEWATSEDADFSKPRWLGDVDFHLSHQSELLRRDREHYVAYFTEDRDRKLIWPQSQYA